MAINIDFGDSITTDGGTGLGGVTQFDAASSVSDIRQNGYASGALAGVNVDLDGKIVGTFTNGERQVLAAVALALRKQRWLDSPRWWSLCSIT